MHTRMRIEICSAQRWASTQVCEYIISAKNTHWRCVEPETKTQTGTNMIVFVKFESKNQNDIKRTQRASMTLAELPNWLSFEIIFIPKAFHIYSKYLLIIFLVAYLYVFLWRRLYLFLFQRHFTFGASQAVKLHAILTDTHFNPLFKY